MGAQKVSISIVTYNSKRCIVALLDSIDRYVKGVDYHVYVIDNGSTDGTAEIVKRRVSPTLTLIESPANRGFGGGHNMVLDRRDAEYHACINPDIVLKDDVISAMVRYMDAHGDIGLLAPKVLNMDGTTQALPKRSPRLIYLISRRIDLGFLRKYREEYEMRERDENTPFDIEFCSGCFMFLRTALLKELGGFDERFFLYFEDADLTRRVAQRARVEYHPAFQVYHAWARAGRRRFKYFVIQVISMLKYMIKWGLWGKNGRSKS
ncbi:MAG: glycosyltransferase family 2 protein [Christensenellaceae bacterium]|nr:glycosyltransferase family 2 protein [Christensenellaceae bacterium]